MLGFRSQDEIFTTARSSAEKDHIHTAAINGAMKGATIGALAGMLLTFDEKLICLRHRTQLWIITLFTQMGFMAFGSTNNYLHFTGHDWFRDTR